MLRSAPAATRACTHSHWLWLDAGLGAGGPFGGGGGRAGGGGAERRNGGEGGLIMVVNNRDGRHNHQCCIRF